MSAFAQVVCSMCACIIGGFMGLFTYAVMTDSTSYYAAWWPVPGTITLCLLACSFVTMPKGSDQ